MTVIQDSKEHVASHTPGPWAYDGVRVYAPAFDTVHRFTSRDGEDIEHRQGLVALPYGTWPAAAREPVASCEANARLIASAPDLLEALKQLRYAVNALGFDPVDVNLWSILEQADLAIAKAEGH
jgi:hypothetical protein